MFDRWLGASRHNRDFAGFGRFVRDRRATVAIVATIALPAFVVSLALGSEVALWNAKQAKLSQMADAVAYSAAIARLGGDDLASAETTAASQASAAGLDAANLTFSVVLDESGPADTVSATIEEPVERYLSRMFIESDPVLSASATAELQNDADACLIALGPTGSNISIGGNASLDLADCAVASNSSSAQAIERFGSADIFTKCVYTQRAASTAGISSRDTECGAVDRKVAPLKDPLRFVDEPASARRCAATRSGSGNNASATLTDGLCSSSDLDGDVVLGPGVYIFDRDVSLRGSLVGVGVTLVFRDGAKLQINAGAKVSVTAPTDGPLAGIAIFGRNGGGISKINGNAETAFDGIVYFPKSAVELSGTADTLSPCTRVIAWEFSFRGNYSLSSSCDRDDFARNGFYVATSARLVE